jgi:Membrane bound O-acyl transferase family
MTNFRGMAWNWRIANLPSPPKEVSQQLSKHVHPRNSEIHYNRGRKSNYIFLSRDVLLRNSLRSFIVGYLVLDAVKILIIHDSFFCTGNFNLPGPSYLPKVLSSSPVFMRSQRLLLAQLAVYWALQTIFQTASLFFVGVLGSERIGVRGQYWMYPNEWGSYWTVFELGLAGWWGSFWHQSFRFAFESLGKKIVKFLNLDPRSFLAKALQLFIAFSVSGFLHANASHTSIGETRPLRGPFLFFFLQPFGIITQMLASQVFLRADISQYIPKSVRQLSNFFFVHIWFYYTAPLFVGDVAAGGQFLYEPIPISFLRGLGFGTNGDSWYCWGGHWPRFYKGKHWWESGIVT